MLYNDIILHIPHAGILGPDGERMELTPSEWLLVDKYTDELFGAKNSWGIRSVSFPYCRLFCDVERLPHDPLEKENMDVYYSPDRKIGTDRKSFSLYEEHQHRLAQAILASGDSITLLVDCHTFSEKPNALQSDTTGFENIDICIGYNEDWSKPNDAIPYFVSEFERRGYRVRTNYPFSNAKAFELPKRYHSIMIEVNKRLYMNEETGEKNEGFDNLQNDIGEVLSGLL